MAHNRSSQHPLRHTLAATLAPSAPKSIFGDLFEIAESVCWEGNMGLKWPYISLLDNPGPL